MEELGHPIWDADNHYYEALDAFTRHLDPADGPRCVQWATIDGKQYHVLGGKVSRAVANATFNPISKPGCLSEYFRGNPNNVDVLALLKDSEPIRPAYLDPAARVQALDEQGLEGCFMYPTLGMLYEEQAQARPRSRLRHLHRVQPLAARGLGLRPRGPDLQRPLPLVGRRRLGVP